MKDVFDITLLLQQNESSGFSPNSSLPAEYFLFPSKGSTKEAHRLLSADQGNSGLGTVWQPDQDLTGEVVITPHVDIEVAKIGFNLLLEAKGRMAPQRNVIYSEDLEEGLSLVSGESYRLPIQFRCEEFETYIGKNTQIHVKLEVFLVFEQEARNKLFSRFSIKKLFSDNTYRESTALIFRYAKPAYSIVPEELVLKPNVPTGAVIGVSLGFGFILCAVLFKFAEVGLPIAIGIFGVLVAIVLGYIGYRRSLGEFVAEIAEDEDRGIFIIVRSDRNWLQIQHVSVAMEAIERVTDTRGTTDSTYYATIYDSGGHAKNSPTDDVKTAFPWPNKSVPASQSLGNVTFYWQVSVKLKTSIGMTLNLKKPFTVDRPGVYQGEEAN